MSKKKNPKRKHNPKKGKKPAPQTVAASPLLRNADIINRMKPIMDTAQRVRARQREREKNAVTPAAE